MDTRKRKRESKITCYFPSETAASESKPRSTAKTSSEFRSIGFAGNEISSRKLSYRDADLSVPGWQTLILLDEKPILQFCAKYLTETVADELYRELNASENWAQHEIIVAGRKVKENRETMVYAQSPDITYTYSGSTRKGLALEGSLIYLQHDFLEETGAKRVPDFYLLNRYYEKHTIGEHTDNEPAIDHRLPILSLSLGQERVLVVRERRVHFASMRRSSNGTSGTSSTTRQPSRKWRHEVRMPHGSLLKFCPGMQQWFSHEVILPRKKNGEVDRLRESAFESRINVTARYHKQK